MYILKTIIGILSLSVGGLFLYCYDIKSIAEEYVYVIQAVSALGTVGAVIVAVYIYKQSHKPKLKAFVNVWEMPPQSGVSGKIMTCIFLQNTGNTTIYIPHASYSWRLSRWSYFYFLFWTPSRWKKFLRKDRNASYSPNSDPTKSNTETELKQGQGTIDRSTLQGISTHKEFLKSICDHLEIPQYFKRFIFPVVIASNGIEFKAKINKSYKEKFFS